MMQQTQGQGQELIAQLIRLQEQYPEYAEATQTAIRAIQAEELAAAEGQPAPAESEQPQQD